MIELDLSPGPSKLRQFGFIALVALALVGGWIYWTRSFLGIDVDSPELLAGILVALGLLSGTMSVVAPRANRPLYLLLAVISFPIGLVLSYVILAFIFYLVLTPMGLLFRLLGHDPLERRIHHGAETYWVKRSKNGSGKERYFRQF